MSAPTAPSVLSIAFLGSGSSGNCAVVRCGETAILVDAGLSVRETRKRLALLGVALEDVSGVFLTHEHSDHVHGALALSKKAGLPVYATAGTADAAGFPGPLFSDVRTVRGGRDLVVGDLFVRVTSTPHDGVESVCYVFADGAGRRVGICCTEIGPGFFRRARLHFAVFGCAAFRIGEAIVGVQGDRHTER